MEFNPKEISASGMVPIIRNLGPNVQGIEIGVSSGICAAYFLSECPNIAKITGVDPYSPYKDWDRFVPAEDQQKYLDVQKSFLAPYVDRFELIRKRSDEVVSMFEDGSMDYVFVDGDHSYNGVLTDCELYYSKVKPGKLFMGHDWWLSDVSNAVHEFRRRHNITIPIQFAANSVWYWFK